MSKTISTSKRLLFVLISAGMLLSFSGCSGGSIYTNYREISTLQLAQTLGIDGHEGKFTLSISTGAGLQGKPSVIISRTGESYVSGEEAIQTFSTKEALYFHHTKYTVFGEDAAKKSIPQYLDYLIRGAPMRADMPMFIVKGGTAKTLVTKSGSKDYDVTEALASAEQNVKAAGKSYPFTCRQIASSLSEYGGALVCAVEAVPSEDSLFGEETGEVVTIPVGFAILSEGELKGYLDEDVSNGVNLITGNSEFATLHLEIQKDVLATYLNKSCKTELTADWAPDNSIERLTLDLKLSGRTLELTQEYSMSKEEFEQAFSDAVSEEIKSRCVNAIKKSQELKCDFMGLKGILQKNYAKQMYRVEDFPAAFEKAEIVVNVELDLYGSYDTEGTNFVIKEGD